MVILELGQFDAAGGEPGGAEPCPEFVDPTGFDREGASAGLEDGEAVAEAGDAGELLPAVAVPADGAGDLDAVDPAQTLRDGTAMDRFRALVEAQGGDVAALRAEALPLGEHSENLTAPRGGTMGDIDAMAVGLAVWRLGAGRSMPGEQVQFGAGLRIPRRPGEPVAAGEPLFTLYSDTPQRFGAALAQLDGAWSVGDEAPVARPLIIDRIGM